MLCRKFEKVDLKAAETASLYARSLLLLYTLSLCSCAGSRAVPCLRGTSQSSISADQSRDGVTAESELLWLARQATRRFLKSKTVTYLEGLQHHEAELLLRDGELAAGPLVVVEVHSVKASY